MKRIPTIIAAAIATIAATAALPAGAASLVKFAGAIGVDPVAGIANGAPALNTVRGVAPGGKPWVIARFKADVKDDGRLTARGEGLVFAAGETIGTALPVTLVAATLFCGTQGFNSPAVALDPSGDFRIDATLADPTGATPPSPCDSPVLLIRNGAGTAPGAWFAAGIPGND